MNYHNEENPIHGIGEALWAVSRSVAVKAGQLILGTWDRIDTENADRVNNPEDELWIERGEN